jgi:hypothetical protein
MKTGKILFGQIFIKNFIPGFRYIGDQKVSTNYFGTRQLFYQSQDLFIILIALTVAKNRSIRSIQVKPSREIPFPAMTVC